MGEGNGIEPFTTRSLARGQPSSVMPHSRVPIRGLLQGVGILPPEGSAGVWMRFAVGERGLQDKQPPLQGCLEGRLSKGRFSCH